MSKRISYLRRLGALYDSYRRQREVVVAPPLRIWLELSSRCNLRCVMCPNQELAPSDRGDMEWGLFQQVIDEAAEWAFAVSLHHRGESLLHPQAPEMIRYASGKGLATKLHTNGTLIDADLARRLLDSGLQRLSFSFDGFTAADYEKIRVGADFRQVVANIESILRLRRQGHKASPHVAVECIRLSAAQVEKEKVKNFLRRFKGLGLDEISIKSQHNWAGHNGGEKSGGKYAACTFPWNALLVLWNGRVVPCAQDFFAACTLGQAGQQSLLAIWNEEPLRRLRRGLSQGLLADFPACRNCDRLWRKTLGGVPLEYLKRLMLNKMP